MIAIFPLSTFSIRNKFDLFFLGKGGTKIKEIQAESGARVFVSLSTKYLFVLCFVQLFFEIEMKVQNVMRKSYFLLDKQKSRLSL